MHIDREQLLRLATFWLRPDFILRVLARFQSIAGFDRAIALASSGLTAMIPLTIFLGSIFGDQGSADRIIARYDLTGDGAKAVEDAFAPASTSTSIGLFGALFLLVAVMSFTRGVQRLFEQTWELPTLSVRNSVNGIKWIGLLVLYAGITGLVRATTDHAVGWLLALCVLLPLGAGFLMVTGRLMSGFRIAWRDLIPFGIVGAVFLGIYSVGSAIYVPHLFNTYAGRYGVIGAVFAMISILFALMCVVVGSAAAGREVRVELDNIRDGIRPSDDEVRKQWDIIISQSRERWAQAREQLEQNRERWRNRRGRGEPPAGDPPAPAP
jgi:membrane protein